MRVAKAPRGIVIDAPFRITPEFAEWLRDSQLRVKGFVRTIPHAGGSCPSYIDPLSADELRQLTDAGFGVTVYQIFRGSRQITSEHGRACGEAAVEHCKEIGLPGGVTCWIDCEAFRDNADTLGFIQANAKRLSYFTDSRGVYIGSNFRLPDMQARDDPREQGDRLYDLKGINRYWQSMSQVWTPSVRGPCGCQIWERVLYGSGPDDWELVRYDRRNPDHQHRPRLDVNAHRIDSKGGRMMWAVK